MAALTRRGTAVNAGRKCPYKRNSHSCPQYARYEVCRIQGDTLDSVNIACGTHVAGVMREVWREFNTAAIVREIPGMWRDKDE